MGNSGWQFSRPKRPQPEPVDIFHYAMIQIIMFSVVFHVVWNISSRPKRGQTTAVVHKMFFLN